LNKRTNNVAAIDTMPLNVLLGEAIAEIERDTQPAASRAPHIWGDTFNGGMLTWRRKFLRLGPIMSRREDPWRSSRPPSF